MSGIERRQARAGWAFVSPALGIIGAFFFVPALLGLLLSLTDFDIYAIGALDNARFIGLRNYARIVADPAFWNAVRNTLVLVVVGGPISVALSLVAALLVNDRLTRWKSFFRTVYFLPVVTTLVAVAITWRYLYHPRYGLLNHALGLLGIPPIDWLGDPHWALPAVILLSVWKNFGYNMLIFVAGLQTIPEELYEAAALDGAGAWRRFLNVTVPSLAPTFLFVGILTMVGFFQVFAEPYVMTQGGPLGATTTVVMFMYEEGFKWWRLGVASAVSFLLFAMMLAMTLVQTRLTRGRR